EPGAVLGRQEAIRCHGPVMSSLCCHSSSWCCSTGPGNASSSHQLLSPRIWPPTLGAGRRAAAEACAEGTLVDPFRSCPIALGCSQNSTSCPVHSSRHLYGNESRGHLVFDLGPYRLCPGRDASTSRRGNGVQEASSSGSSWPEDSGSSSSVASA